MSAPRVLSSFLLVAVFCFLWAFIESIGPAAGLPAEEVVWMRYATHLTVLTLFCWWRYRGVGLVKTEHPWAQFSRSALMLGMPLFFLGAMTHMRPYNALTVFWLAPIMLLVADRKTASNPGHWAAALAAYAGVVLLLRPHTPVNLGGIIFPVGMALCFAGYLAVTRWMRKESEATNLFYTALWVFIGMTMELPFVWQPPTTRGVFVGVLIGVTGLVALYAVDRAVARTSPAAIGTSFYLQPVFASLIQILTVHALPPRRGIAGLVLVCAAVVLQAGVAENSSGPDMNV